jgi:hypothetical protein
LFTNQVTVKALVLLLPAAVVVLGIMGVAGPWSVVTRHGGLNGEPCLLIPALGMGSSL